MRFLLIGLFLYIIYYGYDGMRGDNDLKKLSMDELMKEGIGDSRYLEITGCYSTADIVYKYSQKSPNQVTDVIFPVLDSTSFFEAIFNEIESVYGDSSTQSSKFKNKTMLLIKRDPNKFSSNCISIRDDHSCLDDLVHEDSITPFSVKGTVLLGLDDLDSETKNLISSLNYNISDKVIFLEENSEPKGKVLSFLMILGGILGLVVVGFYFFKNRS
jgi:hypothetical protein